MQPGKSPYISHIVFQIGQKGGGVADANRQFDLGEVSAIGINHLDDVKWADRSQAQLTAGEHARVAQQSFRFCLQSQQLLSDGLQLPTYGRQLGV